MSQNKFHHEQIYRGSDLVTKLATKHVTICGVGALGSNILEGLCRQGVSRLRVIDKDRVETHNLNTQIYDENDVGQLKVTAASDKMFRAVGVEVEGQHKELTNANCKQLLKGTDLVIDAFDNSASRQILRDYCLNKIPCIHVGMADGYAECVWNEVYRVPADVQGDICDYPLARNLVILISAIACEEIIDFILSVALPTKHLPLPSLRHLLPSKLSKSPRKRSWTITLKDLKISGY